MNLEGMPSPLVLFDGECAMCNRWVVWVLSKDTDKKLRFASNSSEVARKLLGAFDSFGREHTSVLVFDGRHLLAESDAVLFTMSALPAPYSWLWYLRFVPRFVRDCAYCTVARLRYRVFGRVSECALLSEDQRKRLL
jgi:predicted DCC family thiol-disulfide oxidoreductase YuxK